VKAVVYKEPCQVAVESVDDPRIENPRDAIIKITSAAICGSDLHMYEGRNRLPLEAAPDAYKNFDARGDEYTKVILKPEMAGAAS